MQRQAEEGAAGRCIVIGCDLACEERVENDTSAARRRLRRLRHHGRVYGVRTAIRRLLEMVAPPLQAGTDGEGATFEIPLPGYSMSAEIGLLAPCQIGVIEIGHHHRGGADCDLGHARSDHAWQIFAASMRRLMRMVAEAPWRFLFRADAALQIVSHLRPRHRADGPDDRMDGLHRLPTGLRLISPIESLQLLIAYYIVISII